MGGKPEKSPVLAGILSGLMPGLGQFYCRQWKRGAAFLVGALVADGALGASVGMFKLMQASLSGTPADDAGSILLRSIPLLAVALWSVVDAVRTAKRFS
ncbi:MAG: hypothetical protein FJ249_03180 [Nitrospira sp.]|nr:hypothetical protein [Nitrospira sp.]